jgi:hypothetical protein
MLGWTASKTDIPRTSPKSLSGTEEGGKSGKENPKNPVDIPGTRHTIGPNAMGAGIQNSDADAARKLPASAALSRRTVRRPPRPVARPHQTARPLNRIAAFLNRVVELSNRPVEPSNRAVGPSDRAVKTFHLAGAGRGHIPGRLNLST